MPVVAEPRREDRVTAPDGLHPIGAPSAHGWWAGAARTSQQGGATTTGTLPIDQRTLQCAAARRDH